MGKTHIDSKTMVKLLKAKNDIEAIQVGAGDLFMQNLNTTFIDDVRQCITSSDVLAEAFIWGDTEQDEVFWKRIGNKLFFGGN